MGGPAADGAPFCFELYPPKRSRVSNLVNGGTNNIRTPVKGIEFSRITIML
jgi:hypothetical protein